MLERGAWMPSRVRKLLTVGHSYVVALNRRLAYEIAWIERENVEVAAVAPKSFYNGLKSISTELDAGENCKIGVSTSISSAVEADVVLWPTSSEHTPYAVGPDTLLRGTIRIRKFASR
jgi:hypothetical protein